MRAPLAAVLILYQAVAETVHLQLRQFIAWWFILQIVLPFTAPLQTLDVHDLFGAKSHHRSASLPESTTTPTISEVSGAGAIAAVQTPSPLRAAAGAAVTLASPTPGAVTATFALASSPQVQQSVLRL